MSSYQIYTTYGAKMSDELDEVLRKHGLLSESPQQAIQADSELNRVLQKHNLYQPPSPLNTPSTEGMSADAFEKVEYPQDLRQRFSESQLTDMSTVSNLTPYALGDAASGKLFGVSADDVERARSAFYRKYPERAWISGLGRVATETATGGAVLKGVSKIPAIGRALGAIKNSRVAEMIGGMFAGATESLGESALYNATHAATSTDPGTAAVMGAAGPLSVVAGKAVGNAGTRLSRTLRGGIEPIGAADVTSVIDQGLNYITQSGNSPVLKNVARNSKQISDSYIKAVSQSPNPLEDFSKSLKQMGIPDEEIDALNGGLFQTGAREVSSSEFKQVKALKDSLASDSRVLGKEISEAKSPLITSRKIDEIVPDPKDPNIPIYHKTASQGAYQEQLELIREQAPDGPFVRTEFPFVVDSSGKPKIRGQNYSATIAKKLGGHYEEAYRDVAAKYGNESELSMYDWEVVKTFRERMANDKSIGLGVKNNVRRSLKQSQAPELSPEIGKLQGSYRNAMQQNKLARVLFEPKVPKKEKLGLIKNITASEDNLNSFWGSYDEIVSSVGGDKMPSRAELASHLVATDMVDRLGKTTGASKAKTVLSEFKDSKTYQAFSKNYPDETSQLDNLITEKLDALESRIIKKESVDTARGSLEKVRENTINGFFEAVQQGVKLFSKSKDLGIPEALGSSRAPAYMTRLGSATDAMTNLNSYERYSAQAGVEELNRTRAASSAILNSAQLARELSGDRRGDERGGTRLGSRAGAVFSSDLR